MKILIVDEDLDFILELQKQFPQDVEWLALREIDKIQSLLQKHRFDFILVRKKNEDRLYLILDQYFEKVFHSQKLLNKLIILPNLCWKAALVRALG